LKAQIGSIVAELKEFLGNELGELKMRIEKQE